MEVLCPICNSPSSFMARHPETHLYRCPKCTHAFSHLGVMQEFELYESSYYDSEHKRWFDHPNVKLFARIAAAIPENASVLDVGCGRGDFLRYLKGIRPDLRLSGIDLSANRDAAGIRYYQGDFLGTDVGEEFDAVVSLAVIEHISDVTGFVERLHELTKPGGVVVVMTLNESSLMYGLARAGNRVGVPLAFNRLYSRHHLHHFTRESLRTLLRSRGFSVESEIVHDAPLAAIDIPVRGQLADAVLRSGMWVVCQVGALTSRSYLQTIICRSTGVSQLKVVAEQSQK